MASDDLDLDIAIAEAEAEAYELQAMQAQRPPQQEREPDYGKAAVLGISDLWNAPSQLGNAANSAIQEHPYMSSVPVVGPAMAMGYEGSKYLRDNPQAIAPTVGAGMTAATGSFLGPWTGAVAAPFYADVANRANEWMGLTEPQDKASRVEEFTRNLSGGVVGVGGAKLAGAGANKLKNLSERFDDTYQTHKANWEEANTPGSSAAPFNAPRGSTPSENMLADDVLQYEDKFYEMNPMKDVVRKPGTTPADEMLKNLLPQKEAANASKAALLEQLDSAGPGIKLDDLDLSKFSRPIEKAQYSAFATGDATDQVLGTLRKSFNIPGNQLTSATPEAIAPSRVQAILNTVDDSIREIGGWDKQTRAGKVLSPSQSAKIEQLPELLKARDALKTALENYSDMHSGSPGAMADLNHTIATARTYEDLIKRHRPEVIQGMTAEFAGGRQMTSPVNPVAAINSPGNTILNAVTDGYARDLGMAQRRQLNLADAWKTPERLQQFKELRNTPYVPQRAGAFGLVGSASESFQGIMDALAPILPGLMSLDPSTGMIHDPAERRLSINAIQNSKAPIAQQAKAISDLNAGKLPTGIEQAPQQVQMPDIGMIAGAAERATGGDLRAQGFSPKTEDDRMMHQMQMLSEVDVERSGY